MTNKTKNGRYVLVIYEEHGVYSKFSDDDTFKRNALPLPPVYLDTRYV